MGLKRGPGRYARISFDERRRLAKIICSGKAPKLIAMDEKVSLAFLSHVKRDFVITTFAEKYPLDSVRTETYKGAS